MRPPKILAPPVIGLLWLGVGLLFRWALAFPAVVPRPWHLLGWALVGGGLSVPLVSVKRFRRAGTSPRPWETPTALVAAGLYRFTRNPMYLGMATALLGAAVLLRTPEMLAVPIAFLFTLNATWVPYEESVLSTRFGAAYDDYRRRVRRWL